MRGRPRCDLQWRSRRGEARTMRDSARSPAPEVEHERDREGSNPAPATNIEKAKGLLMKVRGPFAFCYLDPGNRRRKDHGVVSESRSEKALAQFLFSSGRQLVAKFRSSQPINTTIMRVPSGSIVPMRLSFGIVSISCRTSRNYSMKPELSCTTSFVVEAI